MVMLNCLVFSAVGFIAGIVINSHQEMNRFSSFIITPMSFLCGTFFSLDKMPAIIKNFILVLPLTHTSIALRSVSEDLTTKIVHDCCFNCIFCNFIYYVCEILQKGRVIYFKVNFI